MIFLFWKLEWIKYAISDDPLSLPVPIAICPIGVSSNVMIKDPLQYPSSHLSIDLFMNQFISVSDGMDPFA